MVRKRLSKAKWKEIRNLLKRKDKNISKIARKYKISRNSLYRYANRRNWLIKKEQKKSIWKKIIKYIKKGLNFYIRLCPKINL